MGRSVLIRMWILVWHFTQFVTIKDPFNRVYSSLCVTRRNVQRPGTAKEHNKAKNTFLHSVLFGGVARRKLQMPGTADEHKIQETPTINPIDRQPTHLTDKAPNTNGQPGRRIAPSKTAAVHASAQQQPAIITLTQQGHHQIFSANAARCKAQEQYTGGLNPTTPQTPPASAGTRSAGDHTGIAAGSVLCRWCRWSVRRQHHRGVRGPKLRQAQRWPLPCWLQRRPWPRRARRLRRLRQLRSVRL